MSAYSGLIKVTKKGATAPAKTPPFYSAVDKAVDMLPNKATPEQMIKELLKQKEVKAQELIDRGIDRKLGVPIVQKERTVKLKKPDAKGNTEKVEKYFEVTPGEKGAKAITKDEVIDTVEQNPPKQITEDIMGEPTQKMIDQKIEDLIEKEVLDELGPRPKYGYEREYWLEAYDRLIDRKSYRSDRYYEEAKEAIKQEGNWGSSKYDRPDWKLAGGENYREIVLKLPPTKSANQQRIMELEAYERRGATDKNLLDELAHLRASRDAAPDEFQSKHWDQPNVLAHIRVQDRVGPNGEKILHVEEIQSDWHQTGRDKGYKQELTPEQKQEMQALLQKHVDEDGLLQKDNARLSELLELENKGVPDAPFKKNWHELAMKRLINYASENGYDKIAITPGKVQIDRYEEALRKNLDRLEYEPYLDDNGKQMYEVSGFKSGNEVFSEEAVTPERLQELIGKDTAKKVFEGFGESLAQERPMRPDWKRIESSDLSIGGEGMKGFYDQMLPAYLNKYGEKYGAKVGQIDLSSPVRQVRKENGWFTVDGIEDAGNPAIFNTAEEAQRAANAPLTNKLHSFDITPQMREEVLTKGQPLYQQIGIPAATGAAGAGMLEDEPVFNRSEKVNITDNPDTMFLELNDQRFGVGGAAKKAIKALKGTQKVLPAAEREANLQKFLEPSAEKRKMYHGSKEPNIKEFKTRKEMTDESMMTGHYADERDAVFLSPEPQFTTHFSKEGYTDTHQAPTTYPVYVQVEKPFDFDNPEHLQRVKETYLDMYHNPESDLYDPHMLPSERSMAQHTFNKRIDALPVDENNWPRIENAEFQEILKDIGFDSFYTRERGTKNLGVYDPSRIKSAIGNRGTYDTTQPDINEAQGGLATLKRK